MRKLLSVLLVLVMLFGLTTTALAYTDVTATTQTGPVEKLSALGIIKGYADGTFKPENPITRAEFAAVIVRAMGLETAAKLINTPTKFSDVTANYAWAYGYINIASAKGIVKGDPDGRFRPGDKVSFAEAITMLLRAGGWDAACSTMDWPAGFVMKAVEFGLTDDVAFDANAPANRGAVAVMTYNALAMPMARWNDTSKTYENDQATLAVRYLNAYEKIVIVTGVPNCNPTLKANQVATSDGAMYVPMGVAPNPLLGREMRVIKVGSTYVYMADATPADRVIANVTFVSVAGNQVIYNDGDDNVALSVASTCYLYLNNQAASWASLSNECTMTLFLNETGAVRFVVANKWSHQQFLVTHKDIKGIDGATRNEFFLECGCAFQFSDTTVFVKNGKPATYADLAVGDVAYVQTTGTLVATYVELYDLTVSGKVSGVALNVKGEAVLTVDGINFVIDDVAFSRSNVKCDGTVLAKTGIGSLVNYDVTLKLNAIGKAAVVNGASTALIGRVTSIDDAGDKLTVAVKGVTNTYAHLVACEAIVDTLAQGDYVAMTQRADGKITFIQHFHLGDVYTVKAVDTVNRALTLSRNNALSICWYASSAFGVRLGTWGDASLLKTGDQISFYLRDNTILYFEVNPSFAGHIYGKYIGGTVIEGLPYVYVNVKGEVKAYQSTALPNPAGLDIVDVSLDSMGVATSVVAVQFEGDPDYLYGIQAIGGSFVTVKRWPDNAIQVHDLSSAVVYKADGSLGSLADLAVNKYYKRVLNDTTVVVIQLVIPIG